MNKRKLKKRRPFAVGDRVWYQLGPYWRRAELVEDRGLIGVGGRRIWRVRPEDEYSLEHEVHESDLRRSSPKAS